MDIKLNYIEKGTGFPMILLHGNGENLEYFQHQVEYFSKAYRVIAIDTRGHGGSPRGQAPFTLEQFAEDLKAFLDQMKISKTILLGFSDGGNTALLFTLKYQSYVRALILNGANLNPKGVKRSWQIPIEIGYKMTSLLAPFSKAAAAKKELLGLMVTQPDIPCETLRKIEVPTLVIVGTKDMILEHHTNEIHRYLRRSKLVMVEGDHFIADKKAPAFNKAVEHFLKQTGKKAETQ